jgi:hypothetical protein
MIKKGTLFKYGTLAVIAFTLLANSGGTPGGFSGSNTDKGATCATGGGCHGNTLSTKTAQKMITSDIPSSGYEPGKTYTITLAPSKAGISKWGFEMACEASAGNIVGKFANSADVNIKSSGARATHKSSSNSGTDGRSWAISWTAPVAGTGNVNIYAAVLAANGNGNYGGDNVLIDTLAVSEGQVSSINKLANTEIQVYPNPATELLNVNGFTDANAILTVLDTKGTEVICQKFTSSVNVFDLTSGTYFLKITTNQGSIMRSFVKQ